MWGKTSIILWRHPWWVQFRVEEIDRLISVLRLSVFGCEAKKNNNNIISASMASSAHILDKVRLWLILIDLGDLAVGNWRWLTVGGQFDSCETFLKIKKINSLEFSKEFSNIKIYDKCHLRGKQPPTKLTKSRSGCAPAVNADAVPAAPASTN